MNVSKSFLRDFAYIANLYGWNAEDVEDAKAQTRANPREMVPYWTRLAAAHRAGYQQTADNNFMRLGQWLQQQNEGASVGFSAQYARARASEEFSVSIEGQGALPERSARVREAGGCHA